MGPTRPSTLIVAALASAAVAWLLISRFYYDLPPLPWLPALTLAGLAAAEMIAAQSTRARIERRPGREPVEPLLVARFAVLAKASSLAGAIFGGFYAGVTVWLLIERQRNAHPAEDLPAVIAGLVASVVLVTAALWLESACRVPPGPEDSDETSIDRAA